MSSEPPLSSISSALAVSLSLNMDLVVSMKPSSTPSKATVLLLKRSTAPGDKVLDAFAGSGTIFPAAHQCKLYATGLELTAEYYGIAVNRLNALDDEPEIL